MHFTVLSELWYLQLLASLSTGWATTSVRLLGPKMVNSIKQTE